MNILQNLSSLQKLTAATVLSVLIALVPAATGNAIILGNATFNSPANSSSVTSNDHHVTVSMDVDANGNTAFLGRNFELDFVVCNMDDSHASDPNYRCEYYTGTSTPFTFPNTSSPVNVTTNVFLPYPADNYVDVFMLDADTYDAYLLNNSPTLLRLIYTGNTTTVYRMANWKTHERLFTTDLNEVNTIANNNGWVYENIAFYANNSGSAVYRLANWKTHERLFTTDWNEVLAIKDKNGWVYENISFFGDTSGVAVYRMANWQTKERLFTTDWNEVQAIKDKNGWVHEGTAFYAQ